MNYDFEVDRSRSQQGQISTMDGIFLPMSRMHERILVKHDYSLPGPYDMMTF